MRILLVEDDPPLGDGIRAGLQQQGFQVDQVHNGEAAQRELCTDVYVAAILDLGLPHMDGVDVLRKVHGAGIAVPILVLTARDVIPGRVRSFDFNADDYIVKSIDLHKLGTRLRALVRRAHDHPTKQLRARGIVLEPASRTVFYNGRAVALSTREFDLLHALMLNAERVLSRERLEQYLYPWGQEAGSSSMEVHIYHLHVKLGSDLIVTVRSIGYMLPRGNAEAP